MNNTFGACFNLPDYTLLELDAVNANVCTQACAGPGYFESCILISGGPDAKTRGFQHIAYACTDVHMKGS